MTPKIFDVEHQLVFYGAYHSNKWNVLIHIICVPIILWTAQVFVATAPTPQTFPVIHHTFNQYFEFDFNWTTVLSIVYWVYYFILEPGAALLYTPQMVLSALSATSFAHRSDGMTTAVALHIFSWIAQFFGHGVAEKRAPALLDNLVGAIFLAPFFVHLEILFALGYNPTLHRKMQNGVGKEIAQFRRETKAAQKKKQ